MRIYVENQPNEGLRAGDLLRVQKVHMDGSLDVAYVPRVAKAEDAPPDLGVSVTERLETREKLG